MSSPDSSAQTDITEKLPHVARGALTNFGGTAVRSVILYVFTFALARKLSSSDLGTYFLIATVVNIVSLFSVLGLGMGVVRYVSMYAGKKNFRFARKTLWTAVSIGAPVAILVVIILMVAAPEITTRLFEGRQGATNGLRLFAVAVPFLVLARLFNAATQGMHQMRYQVYSRDFTEQVTKLVIALPMLFLGVGLIGVIFANVISVAVAATVSMIFALMVLPRVSSEAHKTHEPYPAGTLVRYSLPMAFSNVVLPIQLWIDTLLLGYLATASDVGFYGVALKLAVFSSTIDTGFATVFSPLISDLWNRGRRDELQALFKTVTRWIFTFSFPGVLILVLFSDQIMNIFGVGFDAAGGALVLLACGQMMASGTGNVGLMVLMTGRSKLELMNVVLALIVNVLLCYKLIPDHGIIGAAIANMASVWTVNIMRALEVWLLMKMHAYDLNYIKPLLAGIAAGGISLLAARYTLASPTMAKLVVVVAVFGIAYLSFLLVAGLNEQDKKLIKMAMSHFGNARRQKLGENNA